MKKKVGTEEETPKKKREEGNKAVGRPKKEIDTEKVFQLRKEGKSIPKIAKQVNRSVGFVHKILKEGEVKE